MRRLALAAAAAALLLAACSGGDEPDSRRPSPTAEPLDPHTAVLAEIDALPAVDLDDLRPPKAPDGFPQRETDHYAELLTDLMTSSLADERWWTAEPDNGTIAAFMAPLPPQTREAVLSNDYVTGGSPVAQYMVSVFDDASQPVGAPTVVKAAWHTGTTRPKGESVPFQRIRLGVQAVYRTGEDERPVLVRRELSLNGANAFADGAWPGFGYYTEVTGVDTCALYDDGVYQAAVRPPEDVSVYRDWLADARAPRWQPMGAEVEQDNDPAEKRQDACADRTES